MTTATKPGRRALGLGLALAVALPGCTVFYYGTLERFGKEKRHILAERVEASRREQSEAQEEFQSAYDRFKAVTRFDGGDVEAVYRDLAGALERSERKADRVRERVDSVERVAEDLFEEWEGELLLIQNRDLRRDSAAHLRRTETRYQALLAAMRRAESRMDPVLQAFRDQVLYLKHNLNARAIASLEGTVGAIEGDVRSLLAELRDAIREADRFLATLEG